MCTRLESSLLFFYTVLSRIFRSPLVVHYLFLSCFAVELGTRTGSLPLSFLASPFRCLGFVCLSVLSCCHVMAGRLVGGRSGFLLSVWLMI